MQKVITITGTTNRRDQTGREQTEEFTETEYPQLNRYLEDGFTVRGAYQNFSDTSENYSITFLLRKLEER